jgi:uncharacterized protein (DUF2384 family)
MAYVFGTREAALEWLRKKAVGLEGRLPLELMETPQGAGPAEAEAV